MNKKMKNELLSINVIAQHQEAVNSTELKGSMNVSDGQRKMDQRRGAQNNTAPKSLILGHQTPQCIKNVTTLSELS